MKRLCSAYTISGQSITLTGVNVPLPQILLISDATTGSILYSVGGTAATSFSNTGGNSTITLANSAIFSSTDKLTIYYDDAVVAPTTPVTQSGTWTPTLPVGQQAMASSTPVVIASNQSAVAVSSQVSSTASLTAISTATTTPITASSTRVGFIFSNAGSGTAYVLLGATTGATSTNFSFSLATGDIVAINSYTGPACVNTTGTTAFFITTLNP